MLLGNPNLYAQFDDLYYTLTDEDLYAEELDKVEYYDDDYYLDDNYYYSNRIRRFNRGLYIWRPYTYYSYSYNPYNYYSYSWNPYCIPGGYAGTVGSVNNNINNSASYYGSRKFGSITRSNRKTTRNPRTLRTSDVYKRQGQRSIGHNNV